MSSSAGNPRLGIVKTSQPAAGSYVGAGQTVTYSLAITNNGTAAAFDMVISDVLPVGLTFVSASLASTAPNSPAFTNSPAVSSTGLITWTVDRFDGSDPAAAGTIRYLTVTVVARVTDTIGANLTLTNTAGVPYYDSQPGPGVTTALGTIQRTYADGSSSVSLRTVNAGISKTVQFTPPPTATLGSLITYTLMVPSLVLTDTLYGVAVTDTLRPSVTVVSVGTYGGTGGSSGWSGQVVTAAFDSVPVGTQAFVTITARIPNAGTTRSGGVITNVAQMAHASAVVTNSNLVTDHSGRAQR